MPHLLKKVSDIRAFDKNCIGCKNAKRNIMISYRIKDGNGHFHDIFLTQKQAKDLSKELKKQIKSNEE